MRQVSLAAILGLWVFAAGSQGRKPAPAKPIAPAGPPQLWAVAVTDIRPASVRVSWTTDRPAKSAAYAIHEGKPPKFEPRQRLSTALEKIHILTLTGLRPGERYWVRVISEDAQGRRGEADYGTVIPREIPVRRRVRFSLWHGTCRPAFTWHYTPRHKVTRRGYACRFAASPSLAFLLIAGARTPKTPPVALSLWAVPFARNDGRRRPKLGA